MNWSFPDIKNYRFVNILIGEAKKSHSCKINWNGFLFPGTRFLRIHSFVDQHINVCGVGQGFIIP